MLKFRTVRVIEMYLHTVRRCRMSRPPRAAVVPFRSKALVTHRRAGVPLSCVCVCVCVCVCLCVCVCVYVCVFNATTSVLAIEC